MTFCAQQQIGMIHLRYYVIMGMNPHGASAVVGLWLVEAVGQRPPQHVQSAWRQKLIAVSLLSKKNTTMRQQRTAAARPEF